VIHSRITLDRKVEQGLGGIELVRIGVHSGALNIGAEKDEAHPGLLYRHSLIQYFCCVRVLAAQNVQSAPRSSMTDETQG